MLVWYVEFVIFVDDCIDVLIVELLFEIYVELNFIFVGVVNKLFCLLWRVILIIVLLFVFKGIVLFLLFVFSLLLIFNIRLVILIVKLRFVFLFNDDIEIVLVLFVFFGCNFKSVILKLLVRVWFEEGNIELRLVVILINELVILLLFWLFIIFINKLFNLVDEIELVIV